MALTTRPSLKTEIQKEQNYISTLPLCPHCLFTLFTVPRHVTLQFSFPHNKERLLNGSALPAAGCVFVVREDRLSVI